MHGEKWKDIPEFADYYQLSNFGRVKALERWIERATKGDMLLKELVLKQSVNRPINPYTGKFNTHLVVSLCQNAKKTTITIGRMVYYLFVRKFNLNDPTLVIVAKDGDNLNMSYKNLMLVQKGNVQLKTYHEKRKKRPFKSVSKYNTDGHIIKTYISIVSAAKETGANASYISQVANGNISHYGGFLWKFGNRKKIKAVKFPYQHVKRIGQYTIEGRLIRTFFSISEAERATGFDNIGIRDVSRKRRVSYKGFVWKFLD